MEFYNSIVSLLIAALAIGLVGWWLYHISKNDKRPLGEILTQKAILNNETILVAIMLLALASESIQAATVFAVGITHPNIIAGILNHTFIGMIGGVATLTLFRDFGAIFQKTDHASRGWRIAVFLILFTFVLGSPIAQLLTLAANLKQDNELLLWLFHATRGFGLFIDPDRWQEILVLAHKPVDYSAWGGLDRNLKVSIFVVFFHVTTAILEGARHMSDPERRKLIFAGKWDGTTGKSEKESKKEKKKKDPVEVNLDRILRAYGYKDDNKIKEVVDKAMENHKKYNVGHTNLEGPIATKIVNFALLAQQLESGTFDDTKYDDLDAAKEGYINEVKDFFKGSPKDPDVANKRGLGVDLIKIKK